MTSPRRHADDFGPFGGRAWLNCAHQGPLPRVAVEALQRAIAWKQRPAELDDARFFDAPARLRAALAGLLGATPDDVVLGNSATHGLHLLANGLAWKDGDEVLLVQGDFPASVLPWTGLERHGVRLRVLAPAGRVPQPDELRRHLGPRTRVFCASWINSFHGAALDVDALGAVCRERGVRFVLNGSQAVGARPIDVASQPVDAVTSCGYKWLCGPYGTGFLWLSPALRDEVDYNQNYWLAAQAGRPLAAMRQYDVAPLTDLGARRYDVFCTANFFNFVPWTAAVELIGETGVAAVSEIDAALVDRLVDGLSALDLHLVSPAGGRERSTLVVASHADHARNPSLHEQLAAAGVDVAFREGNLRFSPHLYNTPEDIDRAVAALADASSAHRSA